MLCLVRLCRAAAAVGALVLLSGAFAQQCGSYLFKDNYLPPEGSSYVSGTNQIWYANGIFLRNIVHTAFDNHFVPPTPGNTDVHTFGSMVYADASIDAGSTWFAVHGPATTTVLITCTGGGGGGGGGTYTNQMTQLDLSMGSQYGTVMVRESPTLQSLGQTDIEAVTGGYMIDSFFDVFTELSLDGGMSWVPDTIGPTHMCMTPEPSMFVALAVGLGGLLALRRRVGR